MDIELLFTKGGSVRKDSIILKYVFRESKNNEPDIQVLIVVPKKKVRRAIARNRIKRQIREIYRLNLPTFEEKNRKGKTLLLACIYTGQMEADYHAMEKDYLNAIRKLKIELTGNAD